MNGTRARLEQIIPEPSGTPALRAWQAARHAVSSRFGIAARLSVAFAAVAVLAATGNLIAERGTIVLTRTVSAPVHIPLSPVPAVTLAPAPARVAVRERPSVPDTGPLLEEIRLFDSTVSGRSASPGQDETLALQARADAIRHAAAHFTAALAARSSAFQGERLRARVAAFANAGSEVVRLADTRRTHFNDYRARFDNVDARMKSALDKNWKLFGRVISRQSLVVLSRDLDNVRRESSRLTSDGNYDAQTLEGLAAAERLFLATMQQSSRSLQRSQGAQWLDAMRAGFAGALAARNELTEVDRQQRAALSAFEQEATELARYVHTVAATPTNAHRRDSSRGARHTTRTPESRPAGQKAAAAAAAAARKDPPTDQGRRPDSAAPATAPVSAVAAAATDVSPVSQRLVLAIISAIVLLIVLAVSVHTVQSVVRPIRQFMQTARLLAMGDAAARFERGGIRELDALAVSFNEMAEKLAAARAVTHEYQTELEVRVDERTRQLQHLAEHDPLTGLPNRRQLLAYLETALTSAPRGAQVAVFFLDLDNFKNINDSMGHAFGDLVLKGIAHRLREATGGPGGFASRLGGDEFTVVYPTPAGMSDISRVGSELVSAFQRPMLIESRELLVSISVGASVFPDHAQTPDALLRAADAALFNAKTSGRSRLSLFSRELLETASLKFRIEQGLRRAVDRGEFELLFQPEVSFDTMRATLVEALLRWRLPEGRHVAPGEFLQVAEESGLITSINDWVLRSAIQCGAQWHHGSWPDVRVAVNVSARQLLDTRFVDRMRELLTEHRLPARCMEIELTENVLQTGPATIQTLRELRQMGVSIALDDFGTGYSSLASLETLPLTRVKLDRSLISSIDTSERSLAIARAIIGLCDNLHLEVTAEGIERPEQLALLLGHRCMSLQGFLISRPLDSGSVLASIAGMPQKLQSFLLTLPGGGDAQDPPEVALPIRAAG